MSISFVLLYRVNSVIEIIPRMTQTDIELMGYRIPAKVMHTCDIIARDCMISYRIIGSHHYALIADCCISQFKYTRTRCESLHESREV